MLQKQLKRVSILAFLSMVFLVSCKEAKDAKQEGSKETTELVYQCPMDCEKGKTYEEEGSCSVCKMDLTVLGHDASCTCVAGGECKCATDACKCKDDKGEHKHGEEGHTH